MALSQGQPEFLYSCSDQSALFIVWNKNELDMGSSSVVKLLKPYSDVSVKNIDILPNRQYIANTADSAQEQYS